MTDADYADDPVLLTNTSAQAEFQLHCLKQTTGGIGLYLNTNKTEFTCFNKKEPSPIYGLSLSLFGISTFMGYLMPNPSF